MPRDGPILVPQVRRVENGIIADLTYVDDGYEATNLRRPDDVAGTLSLPELLFSESIFPGGLLEQGEDSKYRHGQVVDLIV